ncbi:MAG TPA: RNA polymerase sigma factor [Opitutaceae bacterium]|nr:RNA polymerase sigma factor [Opitutaceae bacterium]HRE06093.1 RNA polymerase sigma factor [Opitutaceae bacterium]
MTPEGDRDLDLLHALQRGEDAALNHLMERWEARLFAFAWRSTHNSADAQDLVAETFVRLYQQRASLRSDSRLAAWLYTTLANLCRNQHRWRSRHPTLSFDATGSEGVPSVAAPVSDAPSIPEAMEQRENALLVASALDRLPHDLRLTVLLYYFERLSYRDIGEVVGCSERGVETRLYRARALLRESLAAPSGREP